jgi:hypothetical protein
MKNKDKKKTDKKKTGKKQVPAHERPLTPYQIKFVAAWNGDMKEAAIAAGSNPKNAASIGSRTYALPQVQEAIQQKQHAFFTKVGVQQARAVTVTRNDIINRLDALSQTAETDSAKVSALRELKDIYGMSSRNSAHDLFAGWTDEELEAYHRTGELPDRFASPDDDGPIHDEA